jgi:hypothetical protein
MAEPTVWISVAAVCRSVAFCRADLEATVIEKSSTYYRVVHRGARMSRGTTCMTNSRGEMGGPWGTSTRTGVGVLGEPENSGTS